MSKIAIISQPDQGVLIDVGGCTTLQEATHHLTSTLQISSEFWAGMSVDLNLGCLVLTDVEVSQVLAIAAEVGIKPFKVFATAEATRSALESQGIKVAEGKPMTLPVGPLACDDAPATSAQETQSAEGNIPTSAEADRQAAEGATACGAPENDEGKIATPAAPSIMYLRQTLRSGQSISHKGHLTIIGDVNPGAEVVAEGDITVWGALRGIAHAGVNGDTAAEIRALRLEPIQLRIAHAIARSPDRPRKSALSRAVPETARIVNGTIRIIPNNPE